MINAGMSTLLRWDYFSRLFVSLAGIGMIDWLWLAVVGWVGFVLAGMGPEGRDLLGHSAVC